MLRYAPVKQLFDSIAEDFKVYDEQNQIDYSTLIKVVKTCNAELSLKINPDAEAIVEVTNYKGKLPDNFEALDFALLCSKRVVDMAPPTGFQMEQTTQRVCTGDKCDVCLVDCDVEYKVIQKTAREWVEFTDLDVVKVVNNSFRQARDMCINSRSHSKNEIKKVGDYIHTNFERGYIYLSYVASLVDEDGQLLYMDDPVVREYYELACKQHILSNLHYNYDDEVERKLDKIEFKLIKAHGKAVRYVNMIEYTELVDVLKKNREKFYIRFGFPFNQNIAPRHYPYY